MKWILPVAALMSVVACGSGDPAASRRHDARRRAALKSSCELRGDVQKYHVGALRYGQRSPVSAAKTIFQKGALRCETVNDPFRALRRYSWVVQPRGQLSTISRRMCAFYGTVAQFGPACNQTLRSNLTALGKQRRSSIACRDWEKSCVLAESQRDGCERDFAAYQIF